MYKSERWRFKKIIAKVLAFTMVSTLCPAMDVTSFAQAADNLNSSMVLKNNYFNVKIGDYGEINSLKLTNDDFDTNYVLNGDNAPAQGQSDEHQWMGELMFQTKKDGDNNWSESMTSASAKDSNARKITRDGNKITVDYQNESSDKGIKDFNLSESYELVDNKLKWSMKVTNTNNGDLTFGDFGLPMPFNEYWTTQGNEMLYESRVIYHSFVGQNSSYIYASRPSGQGKFLLFEPDESTGAKLEYQDHWRTNNGHEGSAWAQDQGGWANGLNVFYIHSNVIKSTGSSYLENTELTLKPGESREYSFYFSPADNEKAMKSELYNDGIIDAVAVPGMAFPVNMPAQFYLHTKYDIDKIKSVEVKCSHDTHLYENLQNSVSKKQKCTKDEGTSVSYKETKEIDGEKYHLYDLKLTCLGANYVEVHYLDDEDNERVTTLQFYAMDNAEDALNLHADFVTDKTQVDAPGEIQDYIFDDWMMDDKNVRGVYSGYFGWGDDWGFTHGEFLAEKNVYLPVKKQIEAVDNYLDTTIWNGLMKEHHEDYFVNDWLDSEPNNTGQGIARGYAYPHVYNTYFSMYKVEDKYPDMVDYKETKQTYLLRAANILKALYSDKVYYNWDTGLMGESTTPDIIAALEKEGFYDIADEIKEIMEKKYKSFSSQKYPYGSEYSYDNTGEEAVYTLAKLKGNKSMMKKIDEKTRACRGLQPVWYHYANPTTICGENWWNFQYSASLIGYCMDDWLRLEDNDMSDDERALAARTNYAAKLANLTAINSGQIDASSANVGTVAWTYQSELGNSGGQGTGGGNIHNGWRQMAGEADTGLFGALHILSCDVSEDPVFGLLGYGCEVSDDGDYYTVKPLDGLYTRLNFINQKLYINLDRDKYSNAVVSKDADSVELSMNNVEGSAHDTSIELKGLKEGSYEVAVNGSVCGSFKAEDGKSSTAVVKMPALSEAEVTIKMGESLSNTAPSVNAGEDKSIELSDKIRLEGDVTDDGYPDKSLSYKWSVETSPADAHPLIKNDDKPISDIKFDKAGEYVFKLIASDGDLSSEDTVTINVNEDSELPETLALYNFDNVNQSDKRDRELLSADADGRGVTSERISNPQFKEGKEGKALYLNGSYCGYVRMPSEITKRVNECTISADVKLEALQNNEARIFEFRDTEGRYLYASVVNGNELVMGMTDSDTKVNKEISTDAKVGINYWKNIAVTIKDNTAVFYVDGVEKGRIENCNFKLADLSENQRNFIGRGDSKTDGFFKGYIDNFILKSKAMTSDEMNAAYGFTGDSSRVSAEVSAVICKVGEKPVLPSQVKVLYSNGNYKMENVTWEALNEDSYSKEGTFSVAGTVEGMTEKVKAEVHVVNGDSENIAASAVPSGIIDSVNDLGGVKGLNDGYEPDNSGDTSHGVWHNWQGNQGGEAWVEYDWNEPVIITGSDAYYFKDGGGNFMPSSVSYQYKDDDGVWNNFENVQGLGASENKYNETTFNPVVANGIRMTMSPKTLGCGVIEWKVYGYSQGVTVNKKALNESISNAEAINEKFVESGYDEMQDVLKEAQEVKADSEATQEDVDEWTAKLNKAIGRLKAKDGNIAYLADVSTSFVSSWETLGAVNDGKESDNSTATGIPHYGTWGNKSAYETVTYTWPVKKEISTSEIYFWNDGGGILTPSACEYQYMNDDGKWLPVEDADGSGVELDKYNVTTFNKLKTRALRVKMLKQVEDSNGVGIVEWKVFSDSKDIDEPVEDKIDKSKLQDLYDAHKDDEQGEIEETKWTDFKAELDKVKTLLEKDEATQEEIDNEIQALKDILKDIGREDKPVEDKPSEDKVDKSKLEELYNSHKDDKYDDQQGDEEESAWTSFKSALAKAKAVLDNDEASQEEVDEAAEQLNEALKNLGKEDKPSEDKPDSDKADKSKLEELYDAHKDDEQGEIEETKWTDFKTELDKVKTLLEKDDATQEEIDNEIQALKDFLKDLGREDKPSEDKPAADKADKSKLQELYDSHKDDEQGEYEETKWADFQKALAKVKEVLADDESSQEEIDEAESELKDALKDLDKEEKPSEDKPSEDKPADKKTDKSELQKLYDAYKDYTENDYSEESWLKFITELDNALSVLDDENATQESINDQKEKLKEAVSGLKKETHKEDQNEEEKKVDKSNLQKLYDSHKNYSKSKYTKNSFENFAEELDNSLKVLNDSQATQEEVDKQREKLKDAIDKLKKKSTSSSRSSRRQKADNSDTDAEEAVVEVLAMGNEYSEEKAVESENKSNNQIKNDAQIQNTTASVSTKGWQKVNNDWYFVKDDGSLAAGWFKDNGKWYFLNNEGRMVTGWFQDSDSSWYYLKSSGEMAHDEYADGYYLSSNGVCQ